MRDPDRTRDIILRAAAGDPTVAPDLRKMARELDALADSLEASAYQSTGGVGDRVKIDLVAPDGSFRRSVDTGGS